MKKYILFSLVSFLMITSLLAQNTGFKVLPLGVKGGLDEANLSAYLVAANGTDDFICLDAGTIYAGIQKAIDQKTISFNDANLAQQKLIKAYFISHGHLDHLAGLVLNAPNDIAKPIYALPSVIDVLKNNYFTWKSWANFANEGEAPSLKKYTYQALLEKTEIPIPNTSLFVTPFSLSHVSPYESTAFLIRNNHSYLLYLGDTGADSVEKSQKLHTIWEAVAPLVINGQLKSIFIEVSFSNNMPDKALFGHLTPKWLFKELSSLNALAKNKLYNTNIVITHIKPCNDCETTIKKELQEENSIGLQLIYPEQGKQIILK